MARHAAPNSIKIIKGETKKNRLNDDFVDVEKTTLIPDCPDWMSQTGIELFNSYCEKLINVDLFTELDIWALQDLAELTAYCQRCYRDNGEPAASVYISLVHTMRAAFGLNVLAREKIKPPAKKEEGNKWAKNKKLKK